MSMQRIQSATELTSQASHSATGSPTPKRVRPVDGSDDESAAMAAMGLPTSLKDGSGKLSKEEKAAKKARKEAKAASKRALPSIPADQSKEALASVEAPALSSSTSGQDPVEFMKQHEITMGSTAPMPCMSLEAAPFPKPLVGLLMKQGFSTPSAVQAAAWPLAMTGRDILAVAKTGSGKTLGYLLPALSRCHEGWSKSAGKPLCLVLAPTRELALQIKEQATKVSLSTAFHILSFRILGHLSAGVLLHDKSASPPYADLFTFLLYT